MFLNISQISQETPVLESLFKKAGGLSNFEDYPHTIDSASTKKVYNVKFLATSRGSFLLRSSHRRCSVKKGVLRNFANFAEKHLYQSLYFNKVAGLRQNFSKFIENTICGCFLCGKVQSNRT